MRVLLVHNYYQQKGGEDTVFATEWALLSQYGHDIIEHTESNRTIKGINKLTIPARAIWSYSSYQKLLRLLYRARPNVVHFHNIFLLISPSAYYACKEAGVPVVQTLHNYRLICPAATFYRNGHICEDCLGRTLPWPGIFRGCWRGSHAQTAVVAAMLTVHHWLKTWQKQVDIYIALTEFARRKFIEGGLPAERIVVKPNFVHPDPGMDEKNNNRDYMLFVGRLSPEKGIQTLLRAWQYLKKTPLKIVGSGPLMGEVQVFVREQNLKCVEVLGQCGYKEVLTLMKSARCLVFPSEWYETFGRVVVEAFACGVPVIASRLGAMAEIVEDRRTGLLFEPGNTEELAAKVEWAWSHSEEIEEMGREARRDYEEKYTAERNYEMLMEIYRRAMGKG